MPARRIVVVSDNYSLSEEKEISEDNKSLDKVERTHNSELVRRLEELGFEVVELASPRELIKRITEFWGDIVFPNWMGQSSRNRAALIPAICEAAGISYIGADAHIRILCADKSLTKSWLRRLGYRTPNWILITREADLDCLDSLAFPVVAKPNCENSSIGITSKNLVRNKCRARQLAISLQEKFNQPVIVEEFCPGREISVSAIGSNHETPRIGACERFVVGEEGYFENALFDMHLKKWKTRPTALRPALGLLRNADILDIKNLFLQLGDPKVLRVDGRISPEGEFSIIELSPSPVMWSKSEFMSAFTLDDMPYLQVLREIIALSGLQPSSRL